MRQLPTGTVSFAFTDVKGSTRLSHWLGADSDAALLGEHRRLLRKPFGRYGVDVVTQGMPCSSPAIATPASDSR